MTTKETGMTCIIQHKERHYACYGTDWYKPEMGRDMLVEEHL